MMGKNSMDCEITNKMVDAYINTLNLEENEDLDFIKDSIKRNFLNDIKKEIIQVEKNRIVKEATEEIDKLEQARRIKEIRVLMYEGVILAFVVGLIVNQFTEILNLTKGVQTKVTITLLWIVILGIVTLIVYKYKFLSEISSVIAVKLNKEERR